VAKKRLGIKACVEAFLETTIHPPEKEPKQEYRRRENAAEIRGFNKAQEHFRGLLELNGTREAAALASRRAEGQIQPTRVGKSLLWMDS